MKIVYLVIVILSIGFAFAQIFESLAFDGQKTNLKLHKFSDHRFNGGQPIVFSGNLFSESGQRIPNAQILIKNDANCPTDGIIAKGFTDKNGRFWIKTIAMVWNTETNLVKIHAEFLGRDNLLPSLSKQYIVVVYPLQGIICKEKN